MNAVELFTKQGDDFKAATIFFCEKCRIVYSSKTSADKCCTPNICECGAECKPYWTKCNTCLDADRDRKHQERVAAAEKLEQWDGPVFSESYPHNDGFEVSVEDMMDCWADDDEGREIPEFVFCCTANPLKLNVSDILERETEEWPEGLTDSLRGVDELQAALTEFCERNKGVASWEPNYKKMVRLKSPQNA